jgi:hypothetical protein
MPPADSLPTSTAMPVGEMHTTSNRTLPMRIRISQWDFEGPYANTTPITSHSGVYAVLTRRLRSGGDYSIVDIGESRNLRNRLDDHDRRDCWVQNSAGELAYAVYYCDEAARMNIERRLRGTYRLPCGER